MIGVAEESASKTGNLDSEGLAYPKYNSSKLTELSLTDVNILRFIHQRRDREERESKMRD
jgi:hypothetical protein